MFTLKVEAGFEAAHRLPEYSGPCRRIHGHSYIVQATWKTTELNNLGISIDLVVLKKLLRQVVAVYDHQSLNTVMTGHTTAEAIARAIFNRLRDSEFGKKLCQVAVEETRGACVIYQEEPEMKTSVPHSGG